MSCSSGTVNRRRTLTETDRFDRRAVFANEDVVAKGPPDPVLRFAEEPRNVGRAEVHDIRVSTGVARRHCGQRRVNLSAQSLDAGRGDDCVIECVDGLDFDAQGLIDGAVATLSRTREEVGPQSQGQPVTLQHQTDPSDVVLPAQILTGVREPDIPPGSNGVTQSGDHLLNIGQIIGRSGFPDLEGEDPGDDHAMLGGPDCEHLRLLLSSRIP